MNDAIQTDIRAVVAKHLPGEVGETLQRILKQAGEDAEARGRLANRVNELEQLLEKTKKQRDEALKESRELEASNNKFFAEREEVAVRERELDRTFALRDLENEKEKVELMRDLFKAVFGSEKFRYVSEEK